ncbi:MAG: tetratricopeptide repeat protein [Candidatus Cybelea sp.]
MEERVLAPYASDFGRLLRHYRLAAGLSQEALAERARISANGIGALERGYRRAPQRETLALLVGALALNEEQREGFVAAAARSMAPRGASVTVGPWADTGIANLPLALTSFVGRDAELDEIARLMRDHRMVTITGAGGVGKTQTALHAATGLGQVGDSGIWFIGLAPLGYSSSVVAAIAGALGVQEVPNRPLLETLIAFLKNKKLLLILDNCEHVIAQATVVADTLLGDCPRVRILATSREPLKAAGEYRYRLSSLSVPLPEATRRLRAADAAEYGAMVLFTDRASAVDHNFALRDENAPIVAEVCRRLDGIPLAIELAAARLNLLSVKALAEKLGDRFRILTGGERLALPRQQTMRAVIDWSYNLLSAPEQRVFERFSVFAGACTLAAAAAVCGNEETTEDEVFDLLSSLIDKSLVVADLDGREPRYRLLESFRQYAGEKLATRDDQLPVTRRHALAYLELAQRLDDIYYNEQEVLPVLAHEELENWRAALQWTVTDRADILLGVRLVGAMCVVWQNIAPVEGQRWLLSARELVDEKIPANVLARLDYTEASIAAALGREEVELSSSRNAVARYRVLGESLGIALAQSREAQALLAFGRVAEAKTVLNEAIPLARSVGNRWLVAWLLRSFGLACAYSGDLTAARSHLAEALPIYEALGAKLDIAWTMFDLTWIDFHAGDTELALRHATDVLAAFRAITSTRGIATVLNSMAVFHLSWGRYGEAAKVAREALDVAREHHLDAFAAHALQHLVAVAVLKLEGVAERKPSVDLRAAQILGFVDARLAAMGSVRHQTNQREYDRAYSVLCDVLGADAIANLMAEGIAMTEERAVEHALAM